MKSFYQQLDAFTDKLHIVVPNQELIFNVFRLVQPHRVRCVLYGEDPYPRAQSANGVAFWDQEIRSWQNKTNGNALKNIMKALLVYKGLASYHTPISRCREIVSANGFPPPAQLFQLWLEQGVLLVNSALTFSGQDQKKEHFEFWRPFHLALIKALNNRQQSPYFILWGNKARKWHPYILKSIDNPARIIGQGHPTFIHQFLKKEQPDYSPFHEISQKTGLRWV